MPPPPDHTWDPATSGPAGSFPPEETRADGPEEALPAAGTGPAGAPDDARYTREGLLGRGGMGVVYLARDLRLDRPVALKEAARGGEVAARLAQEAKVTAHLEHPGIVTVHDSGVTEAGRPFYTMRLLRGRPLSAVLAERPALADRLALVRHYLDACNAVAYAHAEGVVHRDLKPANIMVGGFGETQVVDWGLAARVGERDAAGGDTVAAGATDTRTGAVLGTPAYMSPEQARGEPVGPRSDVWSLWAVLYELLAGRRPRGGGTSDEVLARAREGAVPPLDLPGAPPELLAIAERALAPDTAGRYPHAGALAADVAAWLDGRPVEAHRYTPWELLGRLVRAWRAPLAVGAAALVVGIGVVAAGTWRLARERDRVAAAEKDARAALAASDANLAQALVAEARGAMTEGATAVAAVLATHAATLADAPEAWGVLAGVALEARAERVEEAPLPPCARPLPLGMGDVLCVEAGGVERVVGGARRWAWAGEPRLARLDPDRLYVAGADGASVALDLATGAPATGWRPFGLPGAGQWPMRPEEWGEPDDFGVLNRIEARFCPGGALLAAAPDLLRHDYAVLCGDGRVGRAAIGALPARYQPTPVTRDAFAGIVSAERTPDGRHLVLGGTRGSLALVDPATGETRVAQGSGGAWGLAVSADGGRLAMVGERGEIEVRSLPDLAPLVRVPAVGAREARFAPDGTLLVAGATTMSRWRLPSARATTVLRGPDGLTAAVFSPDGATLATAHGRYEALLWDLASGRRRASLPLGDGTAKAAAFTPDGAAAWFAMTGPRGTWRPEPLRLDGAATERLPDTLLEPSLAAGPTFSTRRIAILRTGTLLAPGYQRVPILAVDTLTRRRVPLDGCPTIEWTDLGQSPGGGHAVLVGEGGRVVRVEPGPPVRCAAPLVIDGARAADVATDGSLVVATADAVVRTDADGRERWRAPWPGGRVLDVAVSADGRWIAAGGADHLARVWDASGRLRAVLAGHTERVASVDFRPDGRVLATGSWDGTARLWGLDVLDVPAATLDTRARAEWGLTLAEALAAAGR